MLSIQRKKYIKSLHLKKNREEFQEFLVEWAKNLIELFSSDYEVIEVFVSEDFYTKNRNILKNHKYFIEKIPDIESVSTIKTNNAWIALVKQKENKELKIDPNEFILVLDDIKDPGNLWTIIRSGDWYGIKKIILSSTSVEFYNPKVISSTMWSFTRVQIFYTDLRKYLNNQKEEIYWAFLNWENIHQTKFPNKWFIVIWNESNWISKNLEKKVTKKITIPSFWKCESLNAWVATSIILDNLKRNF